MSGSEGPDGGGIDPWDWRGPVLAGATWVGIWAGTSGSAVLLGIVAVAALALGGLSRRRRHWLAGGAGLALLLAAGIGAVRVWSNAQGPVAEWASQGAVVTIEARVVGGRVTERGRGGPVWLADAVLSGVQGRGEQWVSGATVRLSASGGLVPQWAAVPAGASVQAVVRLSPAAPDEPVSAWARARASPSVVAPPGPVDAAVSTVRAGLRTAVSGLPADPRALVPALVVGDTEDMSEALRDQFRTTGLTHLTAVSGANLTLLLAAMLWGASRVGVVGWWRRGIALAGVVAFVLLCRAEPSVLRAAAMGLVGLAALGWGGTRLGLRLLSWAVIGLLLVDPWLGRSVGFVLSVFASAGIILWARRWARVLESWLPGWLAEAITVPVAAQLATQPIVTAISGQLSLVGVVANLVAGPLVGPGTVLGFLAAGVSVASPGLAGVLGWLAGGFAQGLCWIAAAGSALPGASISWPAGPVATGLLALTCATVLAGLPLLWRRPWLVILLAVAMVWVLFRPGTPPGWPPGEWQLVSCDVGQGDATVIRAGPAQAIVVDAGPEPSAVDRCLDGLGVTEVPWLILTHLHADHIGGLAGVLAGRRVHNLMVSGITEPASGWRQVLAVVGAAPRTVARPGTVVAAGQVQVAVLALRPLIGGGPEGEDSADANDSSLVLRVSTGGLRVLLAGDVEESGQANAVATVPDLSAQVLVVPHHGSGRQSADFLAGARASVALISVGRDNDYGHPAARTIQTVAGTGARVFRTDLNGSIAVALVDGRLQVTTQRSG
ncbi:MAG: ComEC/Rec2 family competence protein [Propionibacteriaceae bacterium]|nr:ComEC/Rec2 family competence protein [Propionibacteriaceae bacterium]